MQDDDTDLKEAEIRMIETMDTETDAHGQQSKTLDCELKAILTVVV